MLQLVFQTVVAFDSIRNSALPEQLWGGLVEAEVEKAPDEVETVLNEEALEGTVQWKTLRPMKVAA